jgi:tRNA(Arg) A34 adenosine deaminase TadA
MHDDLSHLHASIEQAAAAHARGDAPFGARLIDAAGRVLAEAGNAVASSGDPTAHAEIVALRALGPSAASGALAGATLYTSAEPCAMCAAAAVWVGVRRVVSALSAAQVRALNGAAPTEPGVTGREVLERSGVAFTVVVAAGAVAAARLWPTHRPVSPAE